MNFIRKNRLKMSGSDIANKLGVGKGVVTCFLRREGLQVPKELVHKWKGEKNARRSTSDTKTDSYLKRNYLKVPSKRMAEHIGRSDTFVRTRLRQLGLIIPADIILQRKIDSRIKPGTIPPNKGKRMSKSQYKKCMATMFKKGNIPPNTKMRDGVISIRNDKRGVPYKHIRVSMGVWIPYHRYRWEMFRGPIPAGHCIWFKDGNSLNTKLENLELITRKENMSRNTIARYPSEIQSAIHKLKKLQKSITSCETKLETSQTISSRKSKGSTTKTLKAKNYRKK
jgi:hypothetical protein